MTSKDIRPWIFPERLSNSKRGVESQTYCYREFVLSESQKLKHPQTPKWDDREYLREEWELNTGELEPDFLHNGTHIPVCRLCCDSDKELIVSDSSIRT